MSEATGRVRTMPSNGQRANHRDRRTVRAWSRACVVGLAASLLSITPAQAAPGDLDPSFSGDGVVLTGFGGESDGGSAVAVQADGKIVVAGTTSGYDER